MKFFSYKGSTLALALLAALPSAQAQVNVAAVPTAQFSSAMSDPDAIRVLLSPELETSLVVQMMGRIATLDASLGAAVKKGQVLVALDCSESAARLQMAQAEHDSARETLSVKTNLQKLDAAGDLEVSLARADARRTEASVALQRAQMANCKTIAPFDGRVVKVHVKPYEGVNVGAALIDLVSSGPLKVRLNVPSRLLGSLKIGTEFVVDIAETGRSYPARVSAINGRVDAVAQTVELEAQLHEDVPELLPGMSGVARFGEVAASADEVAVEPPAPSAE